MNITKIKGDPFAKRVISDFVQGKSRGMIYFATSEPNITRATQKLENASSEEFKGFLKTMSDFAKEKLNLKGALQNVIPGKTQEEIGDYIKLDRVSYEELNEFGKKVDEKFINYLASQGVSSKVGKKLDISTINVAEQKLSKDDKGVLKMFKNMIPKEAQAKFQEYIESLNLPIKPR